MSKCCNVWTPKFQSYPAWKLDFNSEIKPVIGSGLDYANATNKPRINGVELVGDKSNEEILIGAIENSEIESLLKSFT